jgi:hypothetical protein
LEAVTLVLNAAASYRGRALLIPRVDRPLMLDDVHRVVQRQTVERYAAAGGGKLGPLFPTETTKPSILTGAKEVVSPIYPASDVLAGYVSQCLSEFDEERLEHSLRLLRSALFERSPELPVDESIG